MENNKLKEILKKHKLWVTGHAEGECINLRGADLRHADLHGADLTCAKLRYADLRYANLHGADLYGANLRCADLRYANLHGANLHDADMYGADLYGANLYSANLCNANLQYADLHGSVSLCNVNLHGTDLRYANLQCANINYPINCPETGSFTGYKKTSEGRIVKLLITDDAKRCSGTRRKCRCSKAKVLEITDIYGNNYDSAISIYDEKFIYEVGEIVEVDNFNENRWNECSAGIHFFITKQEAVNYL